MLKKFLAMKALRGGGSGGGVTNWNDLTDKPFGAEQFAEPIYIPQSFVTVRGITPEWFSEPVDLGAMMGLGSKMFHKANMELTDSHFYRTQTMERLSNYSYKKIVCQCEQTDITGADQTNGIRVMHLRCDYGEIDVNGGNEWSPEFSAMLVFIKGSNPYGLPEGIFIEETFDPYATMMDHRLRYVVLTEEITPIPAKYMPNAVDSLVVNSSTHYSLKQFRITVDDSGTITATEVT